MTEASLSKAVKITKCDEGSPFDLVYQHPGSATTQAVELTLAPAESGPGTMSVSASTATGNATSFAAHNRKIFEFTIPLLTTGAANRMMADSDVQRLAATINAGWSLEMPDCTEVGVLTERAQEALQELGELVRDWGEGEGEGRVVMWDCSVWWAADEEMLVEKCRSEELDQDDLEDVLRDADSDWGPVYMTGVESFAAKIIEQAEAPNDEEDDDDDDEDNDEDNE